MLSGSGHYTSFTDDETEGQSGPVYPAVLEQVTMTQKLSLSSQGHISACWTFTAIPQGLWMLSPEAGCELGLHLLPSPYPRLLLLSADRVLILPLPFVPVFPPLIIWGCSAYSLKDSEKLDTPAEV